MMPQIKDTEAGLKNDAFILFNVATMSSRGIEWMDGKMNGRMEKRFTRL